MTYMDDIKSLVDGSVANANIADSISSAVSRLKVEGENSLKICGVLEQLQIFGVKLIISIDYINRKVLLFSQDFDLVVNNGFLPILEGSSGCVEINGVKVISRLSVPQAERFKSFPQPFFFWFSDIKAFNVESFKVAVSRAPVQSIEHHFYNGDFCSWLENELKRKDLADSIKSLDTELLEGNVLRDALLEILPEH